MLNIINKTPFDVSLSLQSDLSGHQCVCVFFAASLYLSNDRWFVSDKQMASPLTDEYWDPEIRSPIRYPSQLTHDKPGTDVIVNAHAVAPHKKALDAMNVDVSVGQLSASAIVFGDRVWHNSTIRCLEGFVEMPITWGLAFGGVSEHMSSLKSPEVHANNPFGVGWTHPSHPFRNGTKLPNIELPDQLIRSPSDSPDSAGFGALGPESPLRARFAGTYDVEWQKKRCPYPPFDFDPTFFRSAIPALRHPSYMHGQEQVRLVNLNEIADISFELPGVKPEGSTIVNGECRVLDFSLETVVVETRSLEVKLFWRATTLASRSVADIKNTTVWLSR